MKYLTYLSLLTILLTACSPKEQLTGTIVDFGDFEDISNRQLIDQFHFVRLETNQECLFGTIDQIQVSGDNIYILDSYQTRSIYVFDKQGKFLRKLEGNRRGPGEFLLPLCFFINPADSTLIVKDLQQQELFRYALNDLSFIDKLPTEDYPVSFGILPETDFFAFYYPDRGQACQLRITDPRGQIIKELLPTNSKYKIIHGIGQNFYVHKGKLNVFPHFSNTIFEVTPDSTIQRYQFHFGEYRFPNNEFFRKNKYNTQALMSELINNPYVRIMAPYETDESLIVKYYVKQQILLGVYHKKRQRAVNLNPKTIQASLHLGDFPVPIGVHRHEFIGQITWDAKQKNRITSPELQKLTEDYTA
ncbi:MAG: 6-bladed beta-propeller, partial [Odoribacter sp.]|nr:6-bladed beta-propeller [Odoribacter sp.]